MINDVKDFNNLHSNITALAKNNFFIKFLNKGTYKLNIFDATHFRAITEFLSNENIRSLATRANKIDQ